MRAAPQQDDLFSHARVVLGEQAHPLGEGGLPAAGQLGAPFLDQLALADPMDWALRPAPALLPGRRCRASRSLLPQIVPLSYDDVIGDFPV